ncbi:hypothetical protein LINGRAHAP2_LOCUS33365 [Linum grandiflorum]
MRRAWELEFIHVYCEGNHAADYLASTGHEMPFGVYCFPISDPILAYWCHYNVLGVSENIMIMNEG